MSQERIIETRSHGLAGVRSMCLPIWLAQVQPTYAPELNLRGIAVGGFVTNTAQAFTTINGGPFSGLIPSTLPGVLRASPVLTSAFDQYLTAAGKSLLAKSGAQCAVTNTAETAS
jgi:hypothetical protein